MRPSRVFGIVLRQYFLIRGSLARVFPLFVWVAIDIVLWGFITKFLSAITSVGTTLVPALLGAVLFWDFFTRVMHGVTMAFLEDVWSRNFLNIFATPLTTGEYVGGLVLSSIATSCVGLAVMWLVAIAAFGLSFAAYGALIVPFLLVLFLFGIAIGIVGTAIVLRLGPASEWFIWPIPAVLSPFAAVFYPLSTLPGWMQAISHALPPAYVFESMRAIVEHRGFSWGNLGIGAGLSCLYIMLACGFFQRVFRYTVRSGLLARYSAESVT
jgi:ABC-2 type transport system permease protein